MTPSLQIKDYNHSFSHSVGRNGGRSTGGKLFVQLFFVHGRLWLMMVEMSTRRGWGSIQPIQPSHLFILELNSRARLFGEAVGRKEHKEKRLFTFHKKLFTFHASSVKQWQEKRKKTFRRRLCKKIDLHGICP